MSADHSQKSFQAHTSNVEHHWHVIDAKDQVLGRLAQEIATLLIGKHKPTYTPNVECGDFVVVLNAGAIKVSGKKFREKTYDRYTGYPSGFRQETFESLISRRPGEPLRLAVKRMLPKTHMGRKMLTKLKIYAGDKHPHAAQKATVYEPVGRATLKA
jgi:large subunit ribosomal protein L13